MNNEKNIRKLVIREIPHFRLNVVFSFVFVSLIQLIGLAPPLIMQRIIDISIPAGDIRNVMISIIWFCAIPIASTSMYTFYNYRVNVTGRRMGQLLTFKAYEKMIYQPVGYFDGNNSAEVAAYCSGESMKYIIFWMFTIPELLSNVITGAVVFVLITKINISLSIGLLAYIPVLLIPSNLLANTENKIVGAIMKQRASMSRLVTETFKGIRFVKAMVIEKTQLDKMAGINGGIVKLWGKTAAIENLHGSWINSFVDTLTTGIMFAIGSILVINGSMQLGSIVILLNYYPKFFAAVKHIANTNFEFKKQLGEYDKLFGMILMEDERDISKGNKEAAFHTDIVFSDVSFCYHEERGYVLNGLNLSIRKNEWLGIIGSSGAGKSTIFDLLLSLYTPNSGSIYIDGIDLGEINKDGLRRLITKVSQDIFLFSGTLMDNLLLVKPNAAREEIDAVMSYVQLKDFCDSLPNGYDTMIGENGAMISGGERQKLALAQGLLRGSKIILLDEVTSNIDVISENSIKHILRKYMKDKGATVISISHRLGFLDQTDRIAFIENGRIMDTGTYDELRLRNKLFNTETDLPPAVSS